MIALRLHDKGDLRLHEEPVPTPGDDEVLVRVTAVGLCGSDLHWFNEGAIGDVALTQPLVLGHEFVGVIETGERTDERVALDPAIPCGRCGPCIAGDENLCVACRFAGNSIDGALRSQLAWPGRLAHRSSPQASAASTAARRSGSVGSSGGSGWTRSSSRAIARDPWTLVPSSFSAGTVLPGNPNARRAPFESTGMRSIRL